jgi:hypothetical protein
VNESTGIYYKELYSVFDSPVSVLDCGRECAPYNEYGIPFCCDTFHTVPTAYEDEWEYLASKTDLWHLWEPDDPEHYKLLKTVTPEGHVLIECLGHEKCQRNFRSITCRAFPFAPYISSSGVYLGISYYWQYEDRCWVISNLDQVTRIFRDECIRAYEWIFNTYPREWDIFKYHSELLRREFGQSNRAIPLLHRNGYAYKITPHNERMRRVDVRSFLKHGPYKIAAAMPFPDEIAETNNT